ncbi:MAG: hypothetical protein BWY09_01398 [Candidatus Hydrogenedentes bacterium ADurb.Bin179]|nr:MAG: hypothetical protein BWY09_01398 [Candidatus Hydrogenedentes bacterium ADurb.Bin179]
MWQMVAGTVGDEDGGGVSGFEFRVSGRGEQVLFPFGSEGRATGQFDEFLQTFARLLYRPVVAKARNSGRHFSIAPLDSEVVSIKYRAKPSCLNIPTTQQGIPIQHLIHCERQIRQCSLIKFGEVGRAAAFFHEFLKHLHTDTVTVQLAG